MSKLRKFCLAGAGIFISFFFYGIIHEKITKSQYVNLDGSVETFTYSVSLVLIFCFTNYFFTMIILKMHKQEDSTPTKYYCASALVYFLAMVSSNLALQFINYPTQVVAKSCKAIPVMIFNVLLGKKNYPLKKYIFIIMIICGVILFAYKEKKDGKSNEKGNNSEGIGIGELLILSSLFMDGVQAAIQERMRGDYQTKPLTMMMNTNKWASIYLGFLWILTQEVFLFISFLQRQPFVIWKIIGLSICGFFGQFAMITMVVEFGTLPATIVATLRKFFTVLASVLLLGNVLLVRQWFATVLVFSGILLDIIYGKPEAKVK